METAIQSTSLAPVHEILSKVCDPEIPVLSLQDLGVLRDVSMHKDTIQITITPTYAGCPAMEVMRADIESAMAEAGYENVQVKQRLSPAWTTEWMSDAGREKLRAYGIAPPVSTGCGKNAAAIACPQCDSDDVKKISEFGSTACKALYQCRSCLEPFDYFKCI